MYYAPDIYLTLHYCKLFFFTELLFLSQKSFCVATFCPVYHVVLVTLSSNHYSEYRIRVKVLDLVIFT